MLETHHSIFESLSEVYSTEISQILCSRIKRTHLLLNSVSKLTVDFRSKLESTETKALFSAYQSYTKDSILLSENYSKQAKVDNYSHVLSTFRILQREAIESISPCITINQSAKSFQAQENDNKLILILKKTKRISRKIQQTFSRKNKKVEWNRNIPLRQYASLHYVVQYEENIWDLLNQVLSKEIQTLQLAQSKSTELASLFQQENEIAITVEKLKEIEDGINLEITELEEIEKGIEQRHSELLQKCQTSFEADFYKVGTREYNSRRLKAKRQSRKLKRIREKFSKDFFIKEKTIFSHNENWGFTLDLAYIKTEAQKCITKAETSEALIYKQKATKHLKTTEQKIKDIIEATKSSDFFISEDSLNKHKKSLTDELKDDILRFDYNNESKKSFAYTLDECQKSISAKIDEINDQRLIMSQNEKSRGKIEFNIIKPKELIKFEILLQLNEKFNRTKEALQDNLQIYDLKLIDLTHLIDYNFETAKTICSQQNNSEDSARLQLNEGLNLAIEKLRECYQALEDAFNNTTTDTKKTLCNFEQQLLALTNSKNIGELRIRLLKAKALNDSREFRNKGVKLIQTFLEFIKKHTIRLWKKSADVSLQLANIYNQKTVEGRVNAQLANFLVETKNTIESLPFIYQRLFKLDPVSTGYLFFLRRRELAIMRKAYHNWTLDRNSSMVIIGEKGAGVSSHVQHFLQNTQEKQICINFKEGTELYKPELCLSFLASALGLPQNTTKDELISSLNETEEKTIIFAEGIQYLYLRQIEGFECLKIYFDIISATSHNILWINSCTQHAWNYLDKVINIPHYFSYVIELGEFSNDEMIEIVSKRHKVSGYDLLFSPSKNDLKNKKFLKLNDAQKQQFLERQFFNHLNKLSVGNISVALMFWLRSTDGIKNNVLTLKSLQDFDTSFIKELSNDKLFALHILLLHDGLTPSDFCKAMRFNENNGKMILMQMKDTGLIVNIKGRYFINFLLYRTTINALKAQNILH